MKLIVCPRVPFPSLIVDILNKYTYLTLSWRTIEIDIWQRFFFYTFPFLYPEKMTQTKIISHGNLLRENLPSSIHSGILAQFRHVALERGKAGEGVFPQQTLFLNLHIENYRHYDLPRPTMVLEDWVFYVILFCLIYLLVYISN